MMHRYRLSLQQTADSTGYFAALPDPEISMDEGLAYLIGHPNDSFMHAHLLAALGRLDMNAVGQLLGSEIGSRPAVEALVLEAVILHPHLAELKKKFNRNALERLAGATPLIILRAEQLADRACHRAWAELFHANHYRHRPLPPPEKTGLAFPVTGVDGSDAPIAEEAHLKAIIRRSEGRDRSALTARPALQKTIETALSRLEALDVFDGPEMRHQASLSPIALLRKWRFNNQIESGRLAYTLASTQTAYGRGLSLNAARAACLMEVVERCSAFARIDGKGVVGTRRRHPLLYGARTALTSAKYHLVDPNRLGLEVPYRDEPLYWIEGQQITADGGSRSVWVPAQNVYLFCNLDERALYSGLGSTGLAAGNTIAEARLSALYELLERDSQAVSPFHPSRCFRVWAQDEKINALLSDYRARGIHVQFQDISPAFGIPCCTCFVTHPDGGVAKGGGANLDGKRAVLSALTETPYPYPAGPPSAQPLPDLPWLGFEDLPDFSTGIPELDLMRVESTLLANGHAPIYVDITRRDIDIPVVRALLPGAEMMTDFDQYCRVSPRLFNNYLKIHDKG